MCEYRDARPQEEEALLDFLNLVFSQSSRPHDFAALLPKVYAHAGFSALHAVTIRQGRIAATAALLPLTLKTAAGDTLRAGYIGSVATHATARGQGYMRQMMQETIAHAQAERLDMLLLGGQRQRYGYYGFEKGGTQLRFRLTAASVRHTLGQVSEDAVRFCPARPEDAENYDLAERLNERQPLFCLRPRERLPEILKSWRGALNWVVDTGTNECVGYLYALGDQVAEMLLTEERYAPMALKRWMQGRIQAEVTDSPWEPAREELLRSVAESYTLSDAHMLRVLNWPHVLTVLLRLRKSLLPLASGSLVFEINGVGRYALHATDQGDVNAYETAEMPVIRFSEREAVAFFFSPLTLFRPSQAIVPQGWLPLPLRLSAADRF